MIAAKTSYYNGVRYRSKLEASTAFALDRLGLCFRYESVAVVGEQYHGMQYTPDFYIPSEDMFIECAGDIDDDHLDMARLFCDEMPYSGLVNHSDGDGLFLMLGNGGVLHDPFDMDAIIVARMSESGEISVSMASELPRGGDLLASTSLFDLANRYSMYLSAGDAITKDGIEDSILMLKACMPYGKEDWHVLDVLYDRVFKRIDGDVIVTDGVVAIHGVPDEVAAWFSTPSAEQYWNMLSLAIRLSCRNASRIALVGSASSAEYGEQNQCDDDASCDVEMSDDNAIPYIYGENVESEYSGVTFDIETIGSDVANEMYAHNTHNRREKATSYCMDAIKRSEWKFNGASIVFSDDGVLLDGQHRLSGVIKAGKSIVTVVIRGLTVESQVTMDSGVPTTLAKILRSYGYGTYRNLAAITRSLYIKDASGVEFSVGCTNGRGMNISPVKLYAFFKHEYQRRIRPLYGVSNKLVQFAKGIPIGGVACVFDDIRDRDSLLEFVSQVTADTTAGTQARLLTRYLNNNSRKKPKNRAGRIAVTAIIAKAWNAFALDTDCKVLRFYEGTEKFPTVIDHKGTAYV